MVVKNLERIQRMLVQLETMLETDDTVSNVDRRWINESIIRLKRISGADKNTELENLRVLGYDSKAS